MKPESNKSANNFRCPPFAYVYIVYGSNTAQRLANLFTGIHQTGSIMPVSRRRARKSSAPWEPMVFFGRSWKPRD